MAQEKFKRNDTDAEFQTFQILIWTVAEMSMLHVMVVTGKDK